MKRHRYKRLHRILTFYTQIFDLRKPFKVLVDGTFCSAALSEKINIREQVVKYLEDSSCEINTTQCCLAELESLGSDLYGALHICKQFELARCAHSADKRLPAARCLAVTSKRAAKSGRRLIVATQDRTLTESLRQRQGQPVMFIKHKTVLMEKPSEASRLAAVGKQSAKVGVDGYGGDRLKQLRRQRLGETDEPPAPKRPKGPKGPNPLSCKKSAKRKANTAAGQQQPVAKKKRKGMLTFKRDDQGELVQA